MSTDIAESNELTQSQEINTNVPDIAPLTSFNNHTEKDITSSDILQQAFEEANRYEHTTNNDSYDYTQTSVLQENMHPLSDHSYIHTSKHDLVKVNESQSANDVEISSTDSNNRLDSEDSHFEGDNSISNVTLPSSFTESQDVKNIITEEISLNSVEIADTIEAHQIEETTNHNDKLTISKASVIETPPSNIQQPQFVFRIKDNPVPSVSQTFKTFDCTRLKLSIKQTTAPLGSVENPIQIIQHENSYHATQTLTPAQLQQISRVLKQQQQTAIQNGSKSVLYDPSTNTRIVCRVVHPNDLQVKCSQPVTVSSIKANQVNKMPASRGRGRPKKNFGRKSDDIDSLLSKEEREEKKKHRPRTRSGRISKPPSHMVKDYKRIHHLDFDEEAYDDSDGGYSDYHVSDEEKGRSGHKLHNLPPGVTTSKHRSYSCRSCNKAYIGRGGLSRHYRLMPSHGTMPEGEDVSTQDENSNSSLASSVLSNSGGGNTNSQSNSHFPLNTSTRCKSELSSLSQQMQIVKDNSFSERRKAKLKEILKGFSEEELISVCLPKFASAISLWDFFQKKCEKEFPDLRIFEMLQEFEKFLSDMQITSHAYLSPISSIDHGKTIINISSKQIADALSLKTGAYCVKDPSNISFKEETSETFNLNTNLPSDLLQPHAKRKCTEQTVHNITTRLPEQILSNENQEANNIHLPVSGGALSTYPDFQKNNSILCANLPKTEGLFDLCSSTSVTPSSLSTGCLASVKTGKSNLLFQTNGLQQPQLKLRLVGTEPLLLASNLATLTVPSSFNHLRTLAPSNKDLSLNQRDMEVEASSSAMTSQSNFGLLSLDSDLGVLNPCSRLQHQQTVIEQSPVLTASHLSNVQQPFSDMAISVHSVPPTTVEIPITSDNFSSVSDTGVVASEVDTSVSKIQTLLPLDIHTNNAILEESPAFQTPHNEVPLEVTTSSKTSQVLRHLKLPDGQVIGVWTKGENIEQSSGNQHDQGYLPGNLIIIQNPDGSLQVPNNQNTTLDALQTLVSSDQETETQTFTSVQM